MIEETELDDSITVKGQSETIHHLWPKIFHDQKDLLSVTQEALSSIFSGETSLTEEDPEEDSEEATSGLFLA